MRFPILVSTGIILLGALCYQLAGESTYFTSYLANLTFRHNFHEVVPGRLYRSSEMSRADLGSLIDAHGIKSVIDLRLDEDAPDETGKSEGDAAAAHGAKYLHIPFASSKADQRPSLEKLIQAYDELPTPVLVHCSSGTHRSGVASALWLIDKEQSPYSEVEDQLSIKYGFFQIERDIKAFFQGKPTLDRVIRMYHEDNLKTGIGLKDWIKESPFLGKP